MKRFVSIALLFAAGSIFAQKGPVEVTAPVEKLFIPDGFDNNDNVEVVLHGEFPSTCYNVGQVKANVDKENKLIKLEATTYYYPDVYCIQSITPWIESVKLGVLDTGEYEVVVADDQNVTRELNVVERTTESPDDFLYAPVENAQIDVDFATGKQALRLQGRFPYMFIGCMVMKEVRTYRKPDDVLVVQPIAEVVDGPICDEQPADRSFEVKKGLEQPFYGEGLLHVRTLHGSSLNRFIDIQQ